MEVVQLLRTHRAFVILAALLAVLVFQEPEHLFNTQRRGVLLCFIDALGDAVLFLLALMVLVGMQSDICFAKKSTTSSILHVTEPAALSRAFRSSCARSCNLCARKSNRGAPGFHMT